MGARKTVNVINIAFFVGAWAGRQDEWLGSGGLRRKNSGGENLFWRKLKMAPGSGSILTY